MAKGTPTIQEFNELKKEFAKAKKFSEFWDKFLDDWVGRPAFMEMGTAVENPRLMGIVTLTCDQMLRKKTEPKMAQLVAIPEAQMIHGVYLIAGSMGSIIYFEDLGMGLVVVALSNGRTEYARYGLTMPKATVQ